jgi:outer membrane protein assembly factor BamB
LGENKVWVESTRSQKTAGRPPCTLVIVRTSMPWGLATCLVIVSCDYFSPHTGSEQAATCAAASSPDYGSYAASTTTTACVDAGEGEGMNTLVVDSGVTGNVLIADQFNNRVIEITRRGDIVWSFGDGNNAPGPTSTVAPNDAERLPNGETLIAGTGAPPGTEPGCPADGGGCPDNRVIIVDDATGAIVWQYGADGGVSGAGPGQLSAPAAAVLVPTASGDHVLITDQSNARILEIDRATKATVWQFPPASPTAVQTLSGPNSAERLASGNTLIADQGGNRVVEVTTDGSVVWQYPVVLDTALLDTPAFASRLPSGNTLIVDSNNDRVLEIDTASPPTVVWTYSTASRTTRGSTLPTGAVRLANGHTLITETFEDQVIEIDDTPQQNVVYTHGGLGVAGNGANELNQAYDAKVIGDFTGLTPPMM